METFNGRQPVCSRAQGDSSLDYPLSRESGKRRGKSKGSSLRLQEQMLPSESAPER